MNEIKDRKIDQDPPPMMQENKNNNHYSNNVGVYDRPERKAPSVWLYLMLFVLLLVVAVVVFQLFF